ncbi:hypothetical protein KP509_20G089700 [Ceratopteris richardii]|uniref:Uncharacterized protein n=1 Tax=Ceratopteris richardii TaxID=49495 RepID=A0A8T2SJ23_CERRI|nr:hypothetical protein KP509_20G089700 [Ceratopteris richardii]
MRVLQSPLLRGPSSRRVDARDACQRLTRVPHYLGSRPALILRWVPSYQSAMANSSAEVAADHGFQRADMYKDPLAGTVHHYEKHVFLCYKSPKSWPAQLETSNDDELPRLFATSLKAKKSVMPKKIRLTITDAAESSDGDVFIFPDMVKYKGLTASEIEGFVDEVLVNGSDFLSERKETLQGSHIFVCAHERRDMRCGVCGPALIDTFKKEIVDRGITGEVFIRSCSHIGGHKYAGNVLIYSPDANNEVSGHWGQMGLSEEEQKMVYQKWLENSQSHEELLEGCPCSQVKEMNGPTTGCCKDKSGDGSKSSCWGRCTSCFSSWKKSDTLAALAVVAAVGAVAVAFNLSRRSSQGSS